MSVHFTAPHWPWLGPDDEAAGRDLTSLFHYDGGNLATYAKMVRAMDSAIGQILDAVEDAGQRDNTIVVFTSDNGGERFSRTWPFIGQKTELLEGGLRVPTLMRWPAQLEPQVCDQVMATMDWLPTLLAAAGARQDPATPSDGDNLLPVLQGTQPVYPRTLFWRYKAQSQRAVRDGDWKYLKINDNEFLFNLASDVRERANLRQREPGTFERLKRQWQEWDSTMLPISDDVKSHGVTPDTIADRYVPASLRR